MQGVTTPLSVPSLLIQIGKTWSRRLGRFWYCSGWPVLVGFLLVLDRPTYAPQRILLVAFPVTRLLYQKTTGYLQ